MLLSVLSCRGKGRSAYPQPSKGRPISVKLPTLPQDSLDRKHSLADAVAQIIRDEIASGRLGDGARLPQEGDLIRHFGISRPTCREALRILRSEGLVSITRGNGGGPRVSIPTPDRLARYASLPLRMRGATLHDVLETRRLLEPAAVARLARAGDKAVVAKLAQIAVAQRYAVDDRQTSNALELEFRHVIVENCDSEPLRLFGLLMHELVKEQWAKIQNGVPTHKHYVAEHEHATKVKLRLVDLIDQGKAAEAEREWANYLDDYEKGVARHGGSDLLF